MKKHLLLSFALINIISAFSQTLNLPPRSASALTGSQFVATISSGSLSLTSRENMIFTEISNGNIPDFYRNMKPVTSSAVISGVTQSVTYYVIPDYLAVGCDTNYFLCPMSPMLATQIADLTGCTLPTRKMVNDIWSAASVKLSPSTISAGSGMTTVPVFDQHNTTVEGQRNAVAGTFPLGNLVSGDKKDVVISNSIYTAANRVVIYGWHYTNGTAIQPLSNIHSDTYMDYSHGIRLVQNAVVYNGTPTTIKNILQSSILNGLLSDEGTMANPQYPYSTAVTSLDKPITFAVTRLSSSSIKVFVANDADATHYKIYTSTNGSSFTSPVTLVKSNLQLTGLSADQIYFVKIEAFNQTYNVTSSISEVLAATTSILPDSLLIVNGFDRASAGNTYNFCIQHGNAIWNKMKGFSSCSNEALTSGLIDIQDYYAVDYILGEESSANETFSNSEQTIVKQYLQDGGNLFVSGAEIGWDLDQLGSTNDKDFYNNYLKVFYVDDAPNGGTANSCYNSVTQNSFYSIDSVQFDNGTHGTYNVDYPDVFSLNGGIGDMTYCSVNEVSTMHYSGIFPGGSSVGKLVHWAFPFETVYNAAQRNSMMGSIIDFFYDPSLSTSIKENDNEVFNVYPNPSNGIFQITSEVQGEFSVYDITGRLIVEGKKDEKTFILDLTNTETGMYFLKMGNSIARIIKK
ncbi:MAG: hypothetical protein K0S44_3124 [Bacteroidetes bacterium]|jgi:hypothetical protein|nr:hypothetical protein [Bacteroidota bacterium]